MNRRRFLGAVAASTATAGCLVSPPTRRGASEATGTDTQAERNVSTTRTPTRIPMSDDAWPSFGANPANTAAVNGSGPSGSSVRWDFNAQGSDLLAPPAVVDGIAYFPSGPQVYALNVREREVPWVSETQFEADAFAPAVADDALIVGSGMTPTEARLHALDPANGDKLWTAAPGASTSPKIADGTVYVGVSHVGSDTNGDSSESPETGLVAIDVVTESNKWYFAPSVDGESVAVRSTPAMAGDTVYVVVTYNTASGHRNRLYALDTATGDERWHVDRPGTNRNAAPAVADGTVYYGADTGTLYAIDTARGTERWRANTGSGSVCSPAVGTDTVYIGNLSGRVVALATADGSVRWTSKAPNYWSNPTLAGDTLFLGGDSITALDAATGKRRWEYDLDSVYSSSFTSPVVVGNRLLAGACLKPTSQDIRYDNHVYVL